MGGLSIWHWLVVAIVIMLLFGKGRISDMMGDLAKGIKSFKTGLADDEETPASPPKQVESKPVPPPTAPSVSETTTPPAEPKG
ncbi:MAG: twin-arginine translocase TatA/TatE family subunit [Pacificimonas sp.]